MLAVLHINDVFPTLEAAERTQAGSATDYREETAAKGSVVVVSSSLASGQV